MCASEATSFSSSLKNRVLLNLKNFPHLAFSGMLQLLCTYDPQLSQGLTVEEKSAPLHGTYTYLKQRYIVHPGICDDGKDRLTFINLFK
jgi:hypothetical protein